MENKALMQARSGLYLALAEALAPDGPAAWMELPGGDWPLTGHAYQLAFHSPAARQASLALAQIPGESLARRNARYTTLFGGTERPQIWLYESMQCSGRLLGPESAAVEKYYMAAGTAVNGAELPDHASIELAFLAHLSRQGRSASAIERDFIDQHAGRWLPALGRRMASSGDIVYAPIGALLAGWLKEATRLPAITSTSVNRRGRIPVIPVEEQCSLCGFCAQVCPTRALSILESGPESALVLWQAACIGCGKCERVCAFQALRLQNPLSGAAVVGKVERLVLRRSPQVSCQACGADIASQAELAFVGQKLGYPTWLAYCCECRPLL